MFDRLSQWEKENNAICFIVVTTEELRDALSYYPLFDSHDDECQWNIFDVSEKLVYDALEYVYDSINFDYGISYEQINDECYAYLVEKLSVIEEVIDRGLPRGNLWNSETKQFETVKEFLAKQGERSAS